MGLTSLQPEKQVKGALEIGNGQQRGLRGRWAYDLFQVAFQREAWKEAPRRCCPKGATLEHSKGP